MMNDDTVDSAQTTGQDFRISLGRRIHRAIVSCGKSYAEVAKEAGKSAQAVYGWVKTGRVGKDTLAKIAKSTGTSVEWLISGQDYALEKKSFLVASVPVLEWNQIGNPAAAGGEMQVVVTDRI